MCVLAAKYFKGHGWVGVKNRDRIYPTTVKIRKSFKKNIERLYIWDELTRFSEGLNEHGLCILDSCAIWEGKEDLVDPDAPHSGDDDFWSPDGKRIRRALLEKTPEAAAKSLIENKLPGIAFIFNEDKFLLLEATYHNFGEPNEEYVHKLVEISKNDLVVRANHGILIPEMGYKADDPDPKYRMFRKSSDVRYATVLKNAKPAKTPEDLMDAISTTDNKDPMMNPIRIHKIRGKTPRTTGQLMLSPKERTMHYRPVVGGVNLVNYNDLTHSASKTFFEVISARRLVTTGAIKETVDKILEASRLTFGSDE